MILRYPPKCEVERWTPQRDTFKLVRAKTLLPPPETPHEHNVQGIIDAKLKCCDSAHRETIEKAIGYGPR